MELNILQENLHHALQDIQKFVPSRPSLPILGCVLVSAKESGEVILSATDLNIGIQAQAPAQVKTAGMCAIPAKAFAEFVGTLSAGSLEIHVSGQTVKVSGGGSHAIFQS